MIGISIWLRTVLNIRCLAHSSRLFPRTRLADILFLR